MAFVVDATQSFKCRARVAREIIIARAAPRVTTALFPASDLSNSMAFPWLRIIIFIATFKGDDVEGALVNVAHIALNWSLSSLFDVARAALLIPKLIASGKVHPETWRKAKISKVYVAAHCALSATILYALHVARKSKLGWFLVLVVVALPSAKCAFYPHTTPVAMVMILILVAVYRFEGAQELFVGLVLFQGVPLAQDLGRSAVAGRRKRADASVAFGIWACAFASVAPIVGIFLTAYFAPETLERLVRHRKREKYRGIWMKFETYARVLGYSDESGEDPFRALGLPQTASRAQIRKRFRDLSMKYHPDKTGNDEKKKEMFIRVQEAMELITKGAFDDARTSDEQAVAKRVRATVARCASLSSVIGIWFGLSILQGAAFLLRRAQHQSTGGDDDDQASTFPDIGPSFVGSSIIGVGNSNRANRHGVDTRVVGGRRVTTPAGPMPVLVPEGTADDDEDEIEPEIEPKFTFAGASSDSSNLRRRIAGVIDGELPDIE